MEPRKRTLKEEMQQRMKEEADQRYQRALNSVLQLEVNNTLIPGYVSAQNKGFELLGSQKN